MKRVLAFLLALTMLLTMAACSTGKSSSSAAAAASAKSSSASASAAAGSSAKTSGDVVTIKLAHNVTIGGTEDQAAEKFAELVKEKTNGSVIVEVYGGGQLGDETALLEGLQLGTVDACLATSAYLSNLVPQFALLDLPFLFSDLDDVKAKLNGEVGDTLKQLLLDQQKMRILGYWDSGFRIMLTKSAPISCLDDIKNRKMRAPEVPVYLDMFTALGAAPTAIPFGEVYTSINTGVVDGVEVCAEEMYTMKFHEVGHYICKTNHIFSTMIPIISEDVFSKLTKDQQDQVLEAAKEATDWEWENFDKADADALQAMADSGIQVTELTDRDAWVAACKDLQDKYAKDSNAEDLLAVLRQ